VWNDLFQQKNTTESAFLRDKSLYCIVFIVALLLSIGASHPQFLLNDEWVTGNQLAQLDQGHQIVTNEGKYGMYPNGTVYLYFQTRNNALGYPLFLPLLSLPALKLIKLLGDNFDYWLMTVWSLLLIILGLLIQRFYPEIKILNRIPISSFLLILAFIIFILDITFYLPFTISPPDAPREAAAIILTNDGLFAGLAVIIFEIIRIIFQDRSYSLFGTVVCVASSSYLIWASSAKDHILEIFLFSLIVFGIVKFYYTKKIGYCFFSFLCVGLLMWERPETGPLVLLFLFIGFIPYFISLWKLTKNQSVFRDLIISPFFTLIGAIPFFINNYIVTKNPIIPSYTAFISEINSSTTNNISIISIGPINISGTPASLIQLFVSQLYPHFGTFYRDLLGILFFPEIGTTGVFILVPIFLVGLVSIPWLLKYKSGQFSINERFLIISLASINFALFATYIGSYPILNSDAGVAPDIRYLAPVYLSFNLIGLIILSKFPGIRQKILDIVTYFLVFTIALVPIFLAVISINKHQTRDFYLVFFQVSFWISIGIILAIIGSIFLPYLYLREKPNESPFVAILGLLIALPFIWQIMTAFLIVNMANSYAGYNFWIPIIVNISHFIFTTI
jgi:hypothetical protein